MDSPEELCEDTPEETQETCERGHLLGTQLEMHPWKEVLCDRARVPLRGPCGDPCQSRDTPEGLQPWATHIGIGPYPKGLSPLGVQKGSKKQEVEENQ